MEYEIDDDLIQHYFCFMDAKTRIGFEVSSEQMIPALSNDSQVEQLIDGSWYYFQGLIKDGTLVLLGKLMEMFEYEQVGFQMSNDLRTIIDKLQVLTQENMNLLVYTVIIQSPMCVKIGCAVDVHAIIAAKMVMEKLLKRKDFKRIDFVGDMVLDALEKFANTVDGHNEKVLHKIKH